jgi:hypothetical protein
MAVVRLTQALLVMTPGMGRLESLLALENKHGLRSKAVQLPDRVFIKLVFLIAVILLSLEQAKALLVEVATPLLDTGVHDRHGYLRPSQVYLIVWDLLQRLLAVERDLCLVQEVMTLLLLIVQQLVNKGTLDRNMSLLSRRYRFLVRL